QRPHFPGHLSLVLSPLDFTGQPEEALKGWQVVVQTRLEGALRSHLGRWQARLGELVEGLGERIEQLAAREADEELPRDERERKVRKLADLDHRRRYVADPVASPTISQVRLPAGGR